MKKTAITVPWVCTVPPIIQWTCLDTHTTGNHTPAPFVSDLASIRPLPNLYTFIKLGLSAHVIVSLLTGVANLSMETTSLTIGGFSQPAVAHPLIEQAGSAEIRLTQHFLWCLLKPSYVKSQTFET